MWVMFSVYLHSGRVFEIMCPEVTTETVKRAIHRSGKRLSALEPVAAVWLVEATTGELLVEYINGRYGEKRHAEALEECV